MIQTKTIFIAPLNWGLGHATRCIPIIQHLKKQGHKVILGSDGNAFHLLQKEFPELLAIELPGYNITYPDNDQFAMHMILSVPKILSAIKREKKVLETIIKDHHIDTIISDNRYGIFHSDIKSIIITHQPNILAPVFSNVASALHRKFLNKFDEVWIPDFEDANNVSGDLSHPIHNLSQAKYIGILSRFSSKLRAQSPEIEIRKPYILAIISGPEPQRSKFEYILRKQSEKNDHHVIVVGGKYESVENSKTAHNLTYLPFASSTHLKWLIENSMICISRSGYSSIMDYISLGKTAIMVPTPGQIEQEYLADYLTEKGLFITSKQHQFDLQKVLESFNTFNPNFKNFDSKKIDRIYDLLNNI